MNFLDMVPSFKRQLKQWVREQDTDSQLAAYLADATDALNWRWSRTYEVALSGPLTYSVTPDVTPKDKRPIILMGSIIYKMGNVDSAGWHDGDFTYSPQQGRQNPLAADITELDKILPSKPRLAMAHTQPLRGFSNGFNPESYSWLVAIGVLGSNAGVGIV